VGWCCKTGNVGEKGRGGETRVSVKAVQQGEKHGTDESTGVCMGSVEKSLLSLIPCEAGNNWWRQLPPTATQAGGTVRKG